MCLGYLAEIKGHSMTDHKKDFAKIKKYLAEQENHLYNELSVLLERAGEHGDLHSVCQQVIQGNRTGETTWQDLYLKSLPKTNNPKKLFGVLVQLTAHFLLSLTEARDKNKIPEAIESLSMAQYHLGRVKGAFDNGLYTLNKKNSPPEAIARQPNDRIEKIKTRVLMLLELRVKMSSKADNLEKVFDLITPDLQKFLTAQHITTPTADGIPRAVSRWRKTDAAFNNKFIQLTEEIMS